MRDQLLVVAPVVGRDAAGEQERPVRAPRRATRRSRGSSVSPVLPTRPSSPTASNRNTSTPAFSYEPIRAPRRSRARDVQDLEDADVGRDRASPRAPGRASGSRAAGPSARATPRAPRAASPRPSGTSPAPGPGGRPAAAAPSCAPRVEREVGRPARARRTRGPRSRRAAREHVDLGRLRDAADLELALEPFVVGSAGRSGCVFPRPSLNGHVWVFLARRPGRRDPGGQAASSSR